MELLFSLIFILVISYIFTLIAKKIGIPTVVALIVAGILIGYPPVKEILIRTDVNTIFFLGDIALIMLMFLAGLETSWRLLYKEKKDAALIAVFGAIVPFFMGFAAFRLLGFSTIISLIVGICMSITAEATKAKVLLELKKLRTKLGAAMMGAGIIDDTIGFVLFLTTTYLLGQVDTKEDVLIIGAITAFFAGIGIQKIIKRERKPVKIFEDAVNLLIIPFFFISMGIHFEFDSLFIDPHLLLLIVVIAITGKMAGVFLIKPFTGFRWKQLFLAGWGMNSRGAVELALAVIALRSGFIPVKLYSSIIVMVLITTLSFPFIITFMVKKNPEIME